jgi:hypothetical protein
MKGYNNAFIDILIQRRNVAVKNYTKKGGRSKDKERRQSKLF